MAPAPAAPQTNDAAPNGGRDQNRARQVEVVLKQLTSLPTLSPIATRLMSLSSAADIEFDEIVGLIEADPALTARLLSLCRRASLGVSQQVTTVKRAAVMLGVEAVQAAVLSVEIYEVMSQAGGADERRNTEAGGPVFDRVGFWNHCLATACAAEMLAESARALKVRPEEAFTAGLVHDLGKLVLDWVLPRTYGQVLAIAETRGADIARIERAVIGVDHHLVGKRLAEHWSLPSMLLDTMWLHGQAPESLPDVRHRTLVNLITLADTIARRMHLGWSGNAAEPPALEPLGAALRLEARTIEEAMARLPDALSRRARDLGLSQDTPPHLVLSALSNANRRLASLHEACRRQAGAARRQERILQAMTSFAVSTRAGSSIPDVLASMLASLGELAGKGFSAAIYQGREGDSWRLGLANPEMPFTMAGPFDAPPGEGGAPMELHELCRPGSVGGAVGLVNWLSEHLPAAAIAAPDLRRLRTTPIVCPAGPAAVLVHEADLAGACGGAPGLESLTCQWAFALGAAAQADGSRRLAEALSQTSRTLNETQQRLTEQQSLARLGELTAGAAHEMNNPLTVISGRSQLLAARLSTARDQADAREIAEAATRLTELISSLHLLARPPEPQAGPVNLADLLRTVVKSARERSRIPEGRPLPPTVRLAVPGQIELIRADRTLLGRALEELVRNAIESGPRDVLELRVAVDNLDGRLAFTMRDDGAGMSPHALTHAFDPFFSEKPAGRQTGMGLAIARRLVELHRGEISLTSTPGQGTTACLTLPEWKWGAAQTSRAA